MMEQDEGIRVDEVAAEEDCLVTADDGVAAAATFRSLVARLPPGTSTGWHRHDAWQTGVVARGRLRHRTEDAERFFGPGDVLVEPPMIDHEASNVSDEELVLVFVAVHPFGCSLGTPRPDRSRRSCPGKTELT